LFIEDGSNPSLSASLIIAPAAFAAGFLFGVKERSELYERGGACRSRPDEVLSSLLDPDVENKNKGGRRPPEGAMMESGNSLSEYRNNRNK
jgi:hypothetical protein